MLWYPVEFESESQPAVNLNTAARGFFRSARGAPPSPHSGQGADCKNASNPDPTKRGD